MKLLAHQCNALNWASDKDNFACFMEMRTGKSLVAIHQVSQWGSGPTLLIAPISTWFDWEHLLKSLGVSFVVLNGPTKKKRELLLKYGNSVEWVITNPEGVSRWGKDFFQLIDGTFDNCLLDESVFIKNPRAKITKLLLKYAPMFLHRMVMTGTPIAEITEDVVTQMIWCNGLFMGKNNFYTWRMRYMHPGVFQWQLKKGVKEKIRDVLKEESFILSAKDAGMFVEQVKKTILVELPTYIRKDYLELQKCWKLNVASTKFGVVRDAWLAQMACGVYAKAFEQQSTCFKASVVKELCEGELVGQQAIVFSRWVTEVFAISNALGCPCITGNTPYNERKRLIEEFREKEIQHLVFQTKTACRGLDLSCTNNAIMCSNYWEYEKRKQIVSRMNHPHRTVPTLFIDVITKDTIEENVYDLLEEKRINVRYFLQRLKVKVR